MRATARFRDWLNSDRTTGLPAVGFVVVYAALLLCVPSQLVVGPIGAPGSPANLWALGTLLWWVSITLGGRNKAAASPVHLALGLVALAVVASYAAGMATGWYAPPSIHQATDDVYSLIPVSLSEVQAKMISAADRGLLSFAGWTGIMLVATDGLRDRRDLETVVAWLSWLAAFVAALGIVQYFTGFDIAGLFRIPGLTPNSDFGAVASRSVLNRVSSTAVHPIEFGVVLAALFPLSLHRTIHAWGRRGTLVPTLLIGAAIPMSVSRSAMLVLGVALAVVWIGWPRLWKRRGLLLAPLAVVALRAVAPGLLGTIRSLFLHVGNDPSITGRTDDYAVILHLYTKEPILGRGLFTFVPEYYRILDNQFLMILLELGAVGLCATGTFFITVFVTARGARLRSVNPQHRHLALVLSGSFAGIVVSYVTFDAWGFPMAAGTTFLLAGLIGAAWRIARQEELARARMELVGSHTLESAS